MDIQSFTPLWGVWHISRQLGSGSFGDVYEAKRTDTGREYLAAVKHIPIPPKGTNMQSLQADGIVTDEASARSYCKGLLDTLTKEIDICYELKGHTNFVSYEDHMIVPRQNEIGYDVFIRMELLSTLPSFITQNGITVGGITKLCEDMCNALSFLEQKRIIHRDIKPANIFVSSSGDFKLGDFGVARHMEGLGSMSVKGTYNYMAPEILKGEAVGANSDVYSLGLVLYRLLNYNRAPFLPPPPAQVSFDEDQAALDKRLNGAALPPPARADLSLPLTNVVMRACEYEAARRFQSAAEMKAALQSFRETQPPPTGFDPDATVAVERNAQSVAQFGTGASAWNRQGYGMSQGSMMQQGMSQGSMMQQGSMNQSGFFGGTNMPAPAQQGQNKTMLGVLIGVISLVAVTLLALVVILVLPRLSEGTTAPEQESLREQEATKPTVIPDVQPMPEESNLSLSNNSIPPDQYLRDTFGVSGMVSSNMLISSVTVAVYDDYDNSFLIGATAHPNAYSYDLKQMDYSLSFDELPKGKMRYEVSATDELEEKVLLSTSFYVNPPPRYRIFKADVSWEQAKELCEKKGGHLATITSWEEDEEIIRMVETAGARYVWLGGKTVSDSYSETGYAGAWITGERFGYSNWCENQPSGFDEDGTKEEYVMLWYVERFGGWSWNDQRNDPLSIRPDFKGKMAYVCEYE